MIRLSWMLALAVLGFANEPLIVESVTMTGADLRVKLETQVGRPYDPLALQRDVKYLYGLGRFDDVRVEATGGAVRFMVAPKPHLLLHEVRMSPHSFGLQPKLTEGASIDNFQAHQLAAQVEKELKLQGYRGARVSYEFTPAVRHEVDLRLNIDAGTAFSVRHVEFEGDLGVDPKLLRRQLNALRTKTMVPLLWHNRPDSSPEAIDADVARLRSFYLSQGFFDARVSADDQVSTVRIHVDAGPRFRVNGIDLPTICPCLMAQRRDAERKGILDFTPSLHVEREAGEAVAEVTTKVDVGTPFYVRRIEFFGLHRYSDTTARRNMLLDEGDLLDQYRLRKSIDRLTQTKLFDGLQSHDVIVQRDDANHVADIKIRLSERKIGSWTLSGPVGPASIAGPVRAAVMSRLPPWGQGIFELSTYTASVGLIAWQQPIIAALAVKKFVPIFALSRGFLPGDSFRSGFVIIPQLGWQGSLIASGGLQLQGRLLPLLTPSRGLTPDLAVGVEGDVNGAILCQAPKPRVYWLRTAASFAVRISGSMAGF
jgi:Surface antigen variable number repeat